MTNKGPETRLNKIKQLGGIAGLDQKEGNLMVPDGKKEGGTNVDIEGCLWRDRSCEIDGVHDWKPCFIREVRGDMTWW